jgi:thymidine kinase
MKLHFKYGTMNSSKTSNLLMMSYNLKQQNKNILLMKPSIDNRFSTDEINSRVVDSQQVDLLITPEMYDFDSIIDTSNIEFILIDEAQFLSSRNVEGLRDLTYKINVICYGLKTDYLTRLFEGSKRLLELADSIEEIKNVCYNCNKKAIINSKYLLNNETRMFNVVKEGENSIDIGAENKYRSLCWFCWNEN